MEGYSSQFEDNYFTERCSGSEAGSYLRLVDFVCHSTLGLRVIKKKRRSSENTLEASGYTQMPPACVDRCTSLIRNSTPLGPYSRTMPQAIWSSFGGGGAVSYERGAPVFPPLHSAPAFPRSSFHGSGYNFMVQDIFSWFMTTLEPTQGQMDGFFSQLSCKRHLEEVAFVGD